MLAVMVRLSVHVVLGINMKHARSVLSHLSHIPGPLIRHFWNLELGPSHHPETKGNSELKAALTQAALPCSNVKCIGSYLHLDVAQWEICMSQIYEALDSMPALSVMTLLHTQNLSAGFLVFWSHSPPTPFLTQWCSGITPGSSWGSIWHIKD